LGEDKPTRGSEFYALQTALVSKQKSSLSNFRHDTRRRNRKHSRLVLSLCLIGLSLGAGMWLTNGYLWRMPASGANSIHRAALIDELTLTYSDPYFIDNVTESLQSAGYSVDYYPPAQVTVDLFRNLPSRDYGLIIIRSHTASSAGIITAEQYSQNKYVYEQLTNQLVQGIVPPSAQTYFAIEAGFVGSEMQGRFPDSTVILMGCGGLQGKPQLANAFIDKGAKFFVGWTDAVTASQTDIADTILISEIARGLPLSQAVQMAAHYPDTQYNSHLSYLSWDQVSGQQLNNFLYALTSWSTIAAFLVLGPAVVILVPKILSKR
jgi:hypothetical protein